MTTEREEQAKAVVEEKVEEEDKVVSKKEGGARAELKVESTERSVSEVYGKSYGNGGK